MERIIIKFYSSAIDDNYTSSKHAFEELRKNNINNEDCLQLKKSFVKLQEEKVKLMEKDMSQEKLQIEIEQILNQLRAEQEHFNNLDDNYMKEIDGVLKEFEALQITNALMQH